MRKLILLTLLLAAAHHSFTQEQALQTDNDPEAVTQIKALEMKLSDLMIRADWDAYAKSLASGYVRTTGDGRTENREQSMATLRSGDPKIVAMIPEDLEVRLYGDTAILTGSLVLTTRQQNRVRERHSRLTEVFIRRSGLWFLAATQITFLAK